MDIDFGAISEQMLTFSLIVKISIIRFILRNSDAETTLEVSLG